MTAGGFFHCSVKSVGRATGRSVVAAAAYRSGERLEDEITGQTFDYRARGGVEETFILTPDNAPAWAQDRERLWNEAERAEGRANGRLATEIELALPHELDAAQRRQLLKDHLTPLIERYGVAVDVAIHEPGEGRDHRNVHAHILVTHRSLGPEGFGDVSNAREVMKKNKQGVFKETMIYGIAANPADVMTLRKDWEQSLNRAYERASLDVRADHRSHRDRGIEQEPTKHLGPTAAEMERRGAFSDRGNVNREITERNADRLTTAALEAEERKLTAEIIDLKTDRSEGMRPLGHTAADIRTAWTLTRTPGELEEALAVRGLTLAAVSAEEARQSQRTAAFAKEVGNFGRVLREGEIVAVNEHGDVYRLNERTTGDLRPEIDDRLAGVDRASLLNVTVAKDVMQEAALAAWKHDRQAAWEQTRPASGIEATIADALKSTMTGHEFAAAIDRQGLTIAHVTDADVIALDALRQDATLAAIVARTEEDIDPSRRFAALEVGEFAAVTHAGDVFRLNPLKLDFTEIEQRLADTQSRMPSVVEACAINEIKRERSGDDPHANAIDTRAASDEHAEADLARAASGLLSGLAKVVENVLGGLFSFFGAGEPKLTPEQAKLAARAADERAETRAEIAAAQEVEEAKDWQIFQQDRQHQQDDLDAALYGRFPGLTRQPGDRDLERERDEGRERER